MFIEVNREAISTILVTFAVSKIHQLELQEYSLPSRLSSVEMNTSVSVIIE